MKKKGVFEFNLDESFPHLPSAPIVEAVIQWIAKPEKVLADVGLREQLAKRLPEYANCQPLHKLEMGAEFAQGADAARIRHTDDWHGFQLTSANQLHIVRFTREGLVFSRLNPYDSWDTFLEEGLRVWRLFVELANPSEVQRLAVRFINRIAPIDVARIGKYLVQPPACLDSLGLSVDEFLYQTLLGVPGHPIQVKVVQAIQPPTPQHSNEFGLIVDVDVFSTRAFPADDSLLSDYLAKMRWLKDKAFFSLLTKSAIKTFGKRKR